MTMETIEVIQCNMYAKQFCSFPPCGSKRTEGDFHLEANRRFKSRRTEGHSQSRDLAGFSKVKAMCKYNAIDKIRQLKYMRALPTRTLCASCAFNPSNPRGFSSLRNGGGPPGWSLALEKLLHGVPKWPALM